MTADYLPHFAVSSPGKVILFGEHAAVYDKPAIAAAVSLRTYLLVLPNQAGHERNIRLEFPDIKLVFECPVDDLPWDVVTKSKKSSSSNGNNKSTKPETLDSLNLDINQDLVDALQPIIRRVTDTFQHAALLAFFYLYVNICSQDTPGYTFTTKSTLPVGAGLGSSATFSVCLSTAFLAISKRLSRPHISETCGQANGHGNGSANGHSNGKRNEDSNTPFTPKSPAEPKTGPKGATSDVKNSVGTSLKVDTSNIKITSSSTTSTTNLGNDDHNLINKWAYIGEKCLHGNPSGIDNTVACRGGAVCFQRPSTLIPMKRFPELKLILTNTKQPRRTKDMVGRVKDNFEKFPEVTKHLLDGIEQITKEAYVLLGGGEQEHDEESIGNSISENPESLKRLLELVRVNHGLLYSLGVSHPKLEKIKALGDELKIGETKLTGAGGGGCAITLLHINEVINSTTTTTSTTTSDSTTPSSTTAITPSTTPSDAHRLHEFRKSLEAPENEFQIFETVLGGPGVGLVSGLAEITSKQFLELDRKALESLEWRYWD